MNKNIINHTLLILYIIVGFVPNLEAIDKVATQFLYLAILNSFTLTYLIFSGGLSVFFKNSFKNNLIVYSLYLFWIWGLSSIFVAFNRIEVLIESSRIFIYIHSFINLLILVKRAKIDLNKILLSFTILLSIEVLFVLSKFYDLYLSNDNINQILGRNMDLRAFTGNINITAFAMTLKVPFLIFFLAKRKSINILLKVVIVAISFFTIFVLGSRGANITLLIILIGILALSFFSKIIDKKIIILVFGAYVLGISINLIVFRNDYDLNYIARTSNVLDTSSQKRIGFYKFALQTILDKPFLGIGLGNWKIFSVKSESKHEYDDYQIPYHVHNDFLEVAAEIGVIGMILFYGIYIYLFLMFLKFFRRPKIPEHEKILGIALALSISVYLMDSFLNFPFTRPVMQIPNLLLMGVSTILFNKNGIILFGKQELKLNDNLKIVYLIFTILGLIGSVYISYNVFSSYKEQNFLIHKASVNESDYEASEIYNIGSKIPNVTAHTLPIDALKATLLMRIGAYDSMLNYLNKAAKANPYIGYPELVKSLYYIQSEQNMDSSYKYAKKAYNMFKGNYNHFEHYINMVEFKRDSIEFKKAYESIKDNFSERRYTKYLQSSARIKNKLNISDQDLIDKLSINNPLNLVNKAFKIMGEIGRENVLKGHVFSSNAEKYYHQKDYLNAAKLFLNASQYNPLEVAYLENAANSYMKANENKKAINILEKILTELNPKTGKSEYLLGIIYLDLDQSNLGCDYLFKSKSKGFKFPDRILNQFCEEKQN